MKALSNNEANSLLDEIGFQIGFWDRLELKNSALQSALFSAACMAPKNASELLVFAQHVAGWLPNSSWKLFHFDNSTSLDIVDTYFTYMLLGANKTSINFDKNHPLLFQFDGSKKDNFLNELKIANLVYCSLLFECHGYLVGSDNSHMQFISIQDGSIEFLSSQEGICGARDLIKEIKNNPLRQPQWIQKGITIFGS